MSRKAEPARSYGETISLNGFRFTEQRRQVYDALMGNPDHPTAVEVFMRVKTKMSSISLATVYNCLETLTECGLVRLVNHHREPSRYCPNLEDHAHLFCEGCGSVHDLPMRQNRPASEIWDLPSDVVVSHHEVSFRGLCPKCAVAAKPESKTEKS
jgi:Fur family peroxide stress response transcriptional regulator